MSAGRLILYIVAAIVIFFGVLFIWGAFGEGGSSGWIITGIVSVSIGLVLIFLASRKKEAEARDAAQEVTYKIDLPGDIDVEKLSCSSCGAELSMDDIKMVSGAPLVNCPYCNAAYQLTENPKW